MKKRTLYYKLFAVTLSVLLLFNVSTVYAASNESQIGAVVSWQSKIQPYLLEMMQETNDKIPVWLWMEDIDFVEVEERVYEKTGLREDNLSVINELISPQLALKVANLSSVDAETKAQVKAEFQGYLERTKVERELEAQRVDTYIAELRAVQKDMYAAKNNATFAKLGIPDERIVLSETQAPVYIVDLYPDEIEKVAKKAQVTEIYYCNVNAVFESLGNELADVINASTVDKIHDEIGLTGNGVKLGIIDTGMVEPGNEILASRITYLENYPQSYTPHATHVAQIAAGNNGVAPETEIYSSSNSFAVSQPFATGGLISALTAQTEQGVCVINASMGSERESSSYDPLEVYVDYMIRSKKITLVLPTGNEHGIVNIPAQSYNAITVGGFFNQGTSNPSDDVMYEGSNYDNQNGCLKPEVIADQTDFPTMISGMQIPNTGTSFAAPFVTGTIALLYELRPTLKTQPEAVKAILMASCHRKVNPSEGDPVETMASGLTTHQGAGAIDPYRAIAIAGAGNYGIRTMSDITTEETWRFSQPAYGSTGLNVSLAWSAENPDEETAGTKIDLDLQLYRGSMQIATSVKGNSSSEMVYVEPSATQTNYMIKVKRYSAAGAPVRYAYAFSVNDTRYQYTDISEGVYYIRNKATGKYLTTSSGSAYQNEFSGGASQMWVLSNGKIAAATTAKNRVSFGTVISGNYYKALTNTTTGESVTVGWNFAGGTDRDGSVSFCSNNSGYALGIYNNSTASNTLAAWSPLVSSNQYQKWYLEPVAYQRGDVNIDGTITTADSQLIIKYYAGTATYSDLQGFLADVDGDGDITSTDARIVEQIAAGVID